MKRAPNTRFALTVIAESGDRFSDFAPYVASINNVGIVAFQAALTNGRTGVFTGAGGPIIAMAETAAGRFASFYSHPDINDDGALCVYATEVPARQTVALFHQQKILTLPDSVGPFRAVGPLGPTMNQTGTIAFRADLFSGVSGVFTMGMDGAITTIADTSGPCRSFHGLPVVNRRGTVVFRADLKNGGKGLFAGSGGELATVVETGDRFSDLALFPSINDAGTVAFGATLRSGGVGVFTMGDDRLNTIVAPGVFESVRNALISNSGQVVFAATPQGGSLGAFAGPDPIADKVLTLGDALFGSTVDEFVLNPVSVNDAGQIALRVKLADGRQFILRSDPLV